MNHVKKKLRLTKVSPVILLIFISMFIFLRLPGALVLFTLFVLMCFVFIRIPKTNIVKVSNLSLHIFFIVGLISSFISFLLFTKVTLISSYFFPFLSFYLFFLCMSMSQRYPDYPMLIERVMFYAFSIIALIAIFEALFNVNLASVIYPTSETLPYMQADRFFVSAIYVNFNDFSAAMIIYTLQLITRIENSRERLLNVIYLVLFAFIFGICFYMGSRGYLVSLLLYLAIRLYLWTKLKFSKSVLKLFIIGFFIAILVTGILFSSYLSLYALDNSNMKRLWIFGNYIKMILIDINYFIWGFGGYLNYQEMARFDCSWCTVDPHNLFLELIIAYGGGAFLSFLFLYIYTIFYFFNNSEYFSNNEKLLTSIFILTFVSGTIPSSSLKYYYIFFILVAIPSIISNVKIRQRSLLNN